MCAPNTNSDSQFFTDSMDRTSKEVKRISNLIYKAWLCRM